MLNEKNTKENTSVNVVSPLVRSKKGAVKGSTVIIVLLSLMLVATLVVGASVVIFMFLNQTKTLKDTSIPYSATYELPRQHENEDEKEDDIVDTTSQAEFNVTPPQTVTGELTTQEVVEKVGPATVTIWTDISSGSGFIISENGYVVTNEHVIDGAKEISVKIPGFSEEIPAVLIGADKKTDIAVLKIEEKGLPVAQLGVSANLTVGERAIAIGNPFGTLDGTVTQGVISALEREITIGNQTYHLLQTDASINSGNSGGPLLNGRGEVIGVTNAKTSTGEGLGFAIPIDNVKGVIDSLINLGYVEGRPYIGIHGTPVTEEVSERYGIPIGIYVRYLMEDGPAEKAGIQVGDVIIAIDGEEILTNDDIIKIRDSHVVGDVLLITVIRNNKELDISLTLEEDIP